MSKNKKNRRRPTKSPARNWRIFWIILVVVVLILAGALIRNRASLFPPPEQENAQEPDTEQESDTAQSLAQETPTAEPEYAGSPICQAEPAFIDNLGFTGTAIGGTSLAGTIGFVMVEQDEAGNYLQIYQHPTWTRAGYLGPFVRDQFGNTFTAPTPFSSVEVNPPEEQNKIYKIDTDSGEMVEFADLPAALPPSEVNPFGVMGLFYDCDSNDLYAGSIAGSTADEVVGRVFQVDSTTGAVKDQWTGMDILGVGVFSGVNGKRLYMGSGRDSGIYSIALDKNGNFSGEPRLEFYLASLEGGDNDKAQRFTFNQDGEMMIKGIYFNYNLSATSQPHINLYVMTYLPESDSWQLKNIERVS